MGEQTPGTHPWATVQPLVIAASRSHWCSACGWWCRGRPAPLSLASIVSRSRARGSTPEVSRLMTWVRVAGEVRCVFGLQPDADQVGRYVRVRRAGRRWPASARACAGGRRRGPDGHGPGSSRSGCWPATPSARPRPARSRCRVGCSAAGVEVVVRKAVGASDLVVESAAHMPGGRHADEA
jgi:hypothetical protein